MTLVELARERADGGPLPSAAPEESDWRAAEGVLLTEALGGGGEALVAAFEELAALDGSDEARGRAARLRGSWETHRGRHEASLDAYAVALELLSGAARDGALLGRAGSLLRLGRFDEAIDDCRSVRRRARRRGEHLFAAAALLNQAVAVHESGRPGAALRWYHQVIEETTAAGDDYYRATATQNLANALVLLERFDEALPLYADAYESFDVLGLRREAAICRYNEGALHVGTGELGRADELLSEAEDALRACGDVAHAALCRLDRGEALLRGHLVPEAHHLLRTAERALRSSAPPAERSRAVLLLARAELARNDLEHAEDLLEEDLPLTTEAVEAHRLELAGRLAALRGAAEPAAEQLMAAADAHGARRPAARCRALAGAAQSLRAAGDLETALRTARSAERLAERVGLPGPRFAALSARFLCEAEFGRRPAAAQALERAVDALESVRAGLGPATLRAGLLHGAEPWLARAIRFELEHSPRAALELAERWRARALVDLLGTAGTDEPQDEELARLRARVRRLEAELGELDDAAGLRRDTGTGSLRALRLAERRLLAATRRRERGVEAGRVDLGAALVPRQDELLLSFHSDDEGTLVFVVDGGVVRCVPVELTRREVAEAVEELNFRMGRHALGAAFVERHGARLEAELERTLRRLGEPLHRALRRALGGRRRVVIVPDGPWQRVPFAALPWDGRRLIEAHELALVPALVGPSVPDPATGAPVVVGFGDARAPAITDECRAVHDLLGDGVLRLAEDATLAALPARGDTPPSVLHLAAHGRFRADAPEQSGVRLADGRLRALDCPALPLAGSLVVLSACESGVSRASAGGELRGLVRGMLAAGARRLVVSQWRIDDGATAALMVRFHELRLGSRDSDAVHALATAQREAAARGEAPFRWAGFSVWLPPRSVRGRVSSA